MLVHNDVVRNQAAMQCPSCGCTAVRLGFKFCPECGSPLSRAPSEPKVVDVGRKPKEEQSVAETKTHSGEGKVFVPELEKCSGHELRRKRRKMIFLLICK